MYADLRVFQSLVAESGSHDELKQLAKTIMEDYCLEDNTYELKANEVTINLRNLYNKENGEFRALS